MAESRPAPLGPAVFRRIGFDRELGRGSRGTESSWLGLALAVAQLLLEAGVLLAQAIDLALFLEALWAGIHIQGGYRSWTDSICLE